LRQSVLFVIFFITSILGFSFELQNYAVTTDIESGLKIAALLEKGALIVFTRAGCPSCEQLKSEVFTTPSVANMLLEQCIVIVVEAVKTSYVKYPFDTYLTTSFKPYETVNYYELVLKKLGSQSLPFTIFLNPRFEILGKIEGYRGSSAYITSLKEFVKANALNPRSILKKITGNEESLLLKNLPSSQRMAWSEFKDSIQSLDHFGVYILQKTSLSEIRSFLETNPNPPFYVLVSNR
jgi:thioredoxin-related protein